MAGENFRDIGRGSGDPDMVPPWVDLSRPESARPNPVVEPPRATQGDPQRGTQGDPPRITQGDRGNGAPQPVVGDTIRPNPRANDPTNPLRENQRDNEGPYNQMWWIDRLAAAGATAYVGMRDIPQLNAHIPQGNTFHTMSSARGIPTADWQAAGRTNMGMLMGGAFVADTILDHTVFQNKTTSLATAAVDVGVPFFARQILDLAKGWTSRYTLPLSLAIAVGAHAAEKYFYETDR